jgi:hypothetical protein
MKRQVENLTHKGVTTMHTNYYYLIQPTQTLQEAINRNGNGDLLPFLKEPALWTRVEGYLITPDYFTHAKIIYQCYIYDLHVNEPIYEQIFGHLPISEETFDIFWTIQRYDLDEDFAHVLEEISVNALQRIQLPEDFQGKQFYYDLLRGRSANDHKI